MGLDQLERIVVQRRGSSLTGEPGQSLRMTADAEGLVERPHVGRVRGPVSTQIKGTVASAGTGDHPYARGDARGDACGSQGFGHGLIIAGVLADAESMADDSAIGVIGGSGLYELDGLEDLDRTELETPFGSPSDAFITGRLNGRRMVFLPRHGQNHRLSPSEIPFLANVWGMKKLGVDRLISVSAVGSLGEQYAPGQLVLVDQFIDRTKGRPQTFYGRGLVVHVPFAEPVCPVLRARLWEASRSVDATVHDGGTYVCIEGPQFSTKAESHLYRSWGAHVIGMTNLPEAKLAREAEISYATVALVTDYDCWHETEEAVTVEAVLAVLRANVERAKRLLEAYVALPPGEETSELARTAARTSIITPPGAIPSDVRRDLDPILGAFLGAEAERNA